MPGDLNLKKSWNPALIKNQTKLWQQEQKTLEEYKQIKLREQELAKEQESLELIALKNKHNELTTQDKLKLSKLDWMYDSPPAPVEKHPQQEERPQKPSRSVNNLDQLDPMSAMKNVRQLTQKEPSGNTVSDLDNSKDHDSKRDLDPMSNITRSRYRERSPSRDHRAREREHRHRHRRHHVHKESHKPRHSHSKEQEHKHKEQEHTEHKHKEKRDKPTNIQY